MIVKFNDLTAHEKDLVNALTDLPDAMLAEIKNTIDGPNPIAYDTFAHEEGAVAPEPCGCLIFDGMCQKDPELFERLVGEAESEGKLWANNLLDFYGLGKDELKNRQVDDLIQSYDRWAREQWIDRDGNGGVHHEHIDGEGEVRDRLRELAAFAAEVRVKVAGQ